MSVFIKIENGGVGNGHTDYVDRPVTWEIRPWGSAGERSGSVIIEGYTEDENHDIVDDFWTVVPRQKALEIARAIIQSVESDE